MTALSTTELFFLDAIGEGKREASVCTKAGDAMRMQPAKTEKALCRTSTTGSEKAMVKK